MAEARNENEADKTPVVRYTWPGREERQACFRHAMQLEAVAQAMGFYLQFIPLTERDVIGVCVNCAKEGKA